MTRKSTKGGILAHVQIQVAAIQKPGTLPTGFSMAVAGKTYDGPGLATLLTNEVAPLEAELKAAAAKKDAETAATAAEPEIRATSQEVDAGFKAYFGLSNQILGSLDISPKVPKPPRTTAQKLQQKLKADETRKQRGTLGPKQKAAIKATTVPSTTMVVDNSGVHVVPATSGTSSTAGTSAPASGPASGSTPTTSTS